MIDNTTIDWFGLRGREENGWTAIQFRRALDTCDTMDVEIKVCHSFVLLKVLTLLYVVLLVRHKHSNLCLWS
jgi:hypothetical protein